MFRLCRYLPGGHFAPHFDGHYDKSPSERSLKTLMVYLNGDFNGGSTNFVDEKQTLYKVIWCDVLPVELTPKPGGVIISTSIHCECMSIEWLSLSPCKPGIACSIKNFFNLSDESLNHV